MWISPEISQKVSRWNNRKQGIMEVNFYIWLVLTIAVTVYAWVGITRWAKNKKPKQFS